MKKKKKTGSGHSKMKLTSQHISLAGFYSLTLPHSIDCTDVVQDCYYPGARLHHLPREVVKDIAAVGVEDSNGLSKVVPL